MIAMLKILIICVERRHYERIVYELRKTNRVDFMFISSRWRIETGDYHIPKIWGRYFGFRVIRFMVANYLLLTKNYDYCLTGYECAFVPLFFPIIKHYTNMKIIKFIYEVRTIPVDHPEHLSKIVEKKFDRSLRFANTFYQGISLITPEMRKYIEQKYITMKKPIGICESGADINFFKPLPRNKTLKGKLGFKDDDFICFYHGDITDKRGIKELVESFAIIKSRHKLIKLCLLGNGNFYEELRKIIIDLRLEDTVLMHDWVEYNKVPEFISIADLCIIPLPDIDWWRVSSPLKLMEYIAFGKNILMTDMVAHKNVVGSGSNYFFLSKITAKSLAEKIIETYILFKTNPDHFSERGLLERERLIDRISWENQSKKLEDFLMKLTDK